MDLKDEQWQLIEPLIPKSVKKDSRGRPAKNSRDVLNGILWILRTGAPWQDLLDRYPSYQTCHRWFQRWVKQKIMDKILKALAKDLRDRGKLDLSECFIDATFAGAKKGAHILDLLSVERGPRSWQLQTAMVFLSHYILKAPLYTKQNWLSGPLITVSSMKKLPDW